jgi:hypothetical protein
MIWASGDGVVVGALVHFYYKDRKAPMSPALLMWSRSAIDPRHTDRCRGVPCATPRACRRTVL